MTNFSILIALLLTSSISFAKIPKQEWKLASGSLTYHVKFPLKTFAGKSTHVKGMGKCNKGKCQFLMAVPIKSFDSGDSNRDNHMLQTTKGALHPMLSVKVNLTENVNIEKFYADAEIQFAGHQHTYKNIKIKSTQTNTQISTMGRIPLVLTDFAIKRPSLLGVSIDDETPVDFELLWK